MKETKKQIVAQTKNEVAKVYNHRIKELESDIDKLTEMYNNEKKLRIELQNKCDEMKEKVEKFEDWNRRLQEYMDMSEDERENYFNRINAELEIGKKLNSMLGTYSTLFGMF